MYLMFSEIPEKKKSAVQSIILIFVILVIHHPQHCGDRNYCLIQQANICKSS